MYTKLLFLLFAAFLFAVPAWTQVTPQVEEQDTVHSPQPGVILPESGQPRAWFREKLRDVLYDNGSMINSPGTGPGGSDESVLQGSLGMSTYGFGSQIVNGNRMADDFKVSDSRGWEVSSFTFFAYQTGSSTTPTINDIRLQIWNGPPNVSSSSVIFGNLTSNVLASSSWTGIYRVIDISKNTTRPVMANVVNVGRLHLDPGTYWVEWTAGGSLSSGPWAPPITTNGQTTTGNALQYTSSGWAAALDTGTSTQQGIPFIVQGTKQGGGGNGGSSNSRTATACGLLGVEFLFFFLAAAACRRIAARIR